MHYLATIIPRSVIDQSWRRHNRLGGTAATIPFTLVGDTYVSRPLTPDQVIEAQKVASIRVEAFGVFPTFDPPRDEQPVSGAVLPFMAQAASGAIPPHRRAM